MSLLFVLNVSFWVRAIVFIRSSLDASVRTRSLGGLSVSSHYLHMVCLWMIYQNLQKKLANAFSMGVARHTRFESWWPASLSTSTVDIPFQSTRTESGSGGRYWSPDPYSRSPFSLVPLYVRSVEVILDIDNLLLDCAGRAGVMGQSMSLGVRERIHHSSRVTQNMPYCVVVLCFWICCDAFITVFWIWRGFLGESRCGGRITCGQATTSLQASRYGKRFSVSKYWNAMKISLLENFDCFWQNSWRILGLSAIIKGKVPTKRVIKSKSSPVPWLGYESTLSPSPSISNSKGDSWSWDTHYNTEIRRTSDLRAISCLSPFSFLSTEHKRHRVIVKLVIL